MRRDLTCSLVLAGFVLARPGRAQTGIESPVRLTAAPSTELRYVVVPEKSRLTFEVPVTLAPVSGRVEKFEGEIDVPAGSPGTLRAHLAIDAGSLSTGRASRDAVMRGRLLESDKFHQIVFEASAYQGDLSHFVRGPSILTEVSGSLTIHGVAQPVRASVECVVYDDHALLMGAVPVLWKAFGLFDPSRLLRRVGDPLTVDFRLWAEPARP